MRSDPKALKAAALDYAARGWRVIALHTPFMLGNKVGCSCPRRMDCRTPGKHPRFVGWRDLATTDPAVIQTWWRHFPQANVGIATGGAAGIVVLDVDGQAGRESLTRLTAEYGPLPETLRQSTGRVGGGTHYLFHVEAGYLDWLRNRTQIAPGIDIRTEGGQIVATPSLHPSGALYMWENAAELAPFPEWLGKLSRSAKTRQVTFSSSGTRPDENLIATVWPLEQRLKLAREAVLRVEPAVEGQNGSRACLKAAITVVRGYLVPPEGGVAVDLLMQVYNPRCSPPWQEWEIVHKVNSATMNVDVPWGYRLSTIAGPEEWDLRPDAVSPVKRALQEAANRKQDRKRDPAPVMAEILQPPAPRVARAGRPALPVSGAALLWTPHPLDAVRAPAHELLAPAVDDSDEHA